MTLRPQELPPQQPTPEHAADPPGLEGLGVRVDGELGAGGIAEFLLNGLIVERLVLPPIEWAVLAMLVQAARSPDAEWTDCFVRPETIVRKLYALSLTDSTDPKVVTKAIFRLRKRLSQNRPLQRIAEDELREPLETGLIETRRFLGYRITLKAEQLQFRERNVQGISKESPLHLQ